MSTGLRIGYVTQWFPPEQGTAVTSSIADGLADRGHTVDVLTGFPNYPSGRLLPGYPLRYYRRDVRSERVVVHRFPLYPSHDGRPVRRAVTYLSFAASSSWIQRRRIRRPDVWLVYSSPATAALPALLAPPSLRAPISLIIQDLWPDSVTASGFVGGRAGAVIDRGLHRYCDWTYRRAARIGVISPGMRRMLVDRGVTPDKIVDTPNVVDDAFLRRPCDAVPRSRLGLPSGRLFMYAGNVGPLQGLEPLVRAFAQEPTAQLAIVGDGTALVSLRALCDALGMRNVTFVGAQPAHRVGSYLAAADVQIVSLRDTGLLRATMPSKVQTATAAGRAVLAHAAGDVADFVTANGIGVVAPPGDPARTRAAIADLCTMPDDRLREMGSRGRHLYERTFSPSAGLGRLEDMLVAAVRAGEGAGGSRLDGC